MEMLKLCWIIFNDNEHENLGVKNKNEMITKKR